MPAGIEAVVADGFATLDFTDRTLLGPSLEKLRQAGAKVTSDTRIGPRTVYRVLEADAVAAGLIDGQTAVATSAARSTARGITIDQPGDAVVDGEISGGSDGAGSTPDAVWPTPMPTVPTDPDAAPEEVATYPAGVPDSGWTNAEIKSYADANNIDLGTATKKADMLAAIEMAS
jgi:hypothetical protein